MSEELQNLFELTVNDYIHPNKKKYAYELWKTMILGYIRREVDDQVDRIFENRFEVLTKTYFDKLQNSLVEILHDEFLKLKKELIK